MKSEIASELRETITQLLVNQPILIITLKDKYVTDDHWKYCIENEPMVFKYKKNPNYDLAYFAVKIDGYNLKYLSRRKKNRFLIDERICVAAIMSNPTAIRFVPKKYRSARLIEMAVAEDSDLIGEYPMLSDEFLEAQIRKRPSLIKDIKNPPEWLICIAIEEDPNTVLYFDKLTTNMKAIIEEKYPYLINQLPHFNES